MKDSDDLQEALRQTVDDSVLTHTGRSIGDRASAHVARDLMQIVEAHYQPQAVGDEPEVLQCYGHSETRLVHYHNDYDDSYCYTELEEGYNDLHTLHVAQVYDDDFDDWKPLTERQHPND